MLFVFFIEGYLFVLDNQWRTCAMKIGYASEDLQMILGFLSTVASCSVFTHAIFVREQLDRKRAHVKAYVQNAFDDFWLLSMLRAISKMVYFSFCHACYSIARDHGIVRGRLIPISFQNS